MKLLKHIISAMIYSLFLTTCGYIETLERGNPLDNPNTKARIVFENKETITVNVGKETEIRKKIYLKNTGYSAANGVKATFFTTSSFITPISPDTWPTTIDYGNIPAKTNKWVDDKGIEHSYAWTLLYTIRFSVSSKTPKDTQIPINISIVDDSGSRWIDSFNVLVQ